LLQQIRATNTFYFLPHDMLRERGCATVGLSSVCPSVTLTFPK